ncbi:thioesterase II family protein [Streptomyces lucensis]|uniref:thioesterase II family protein n=1 Tax=Streptomyces lucensis TaxID=67319 RepID=UPI001E58E3A2|nr:alpha/beta fold hydrolase [Streptomyces lucensis]
MTNSWIRRLRPRPDAAVRLVCFPHAGGSATYYHPLAHSPSLTPAAEVLAVQYPGRQDRRREPLVDSLSLLADQAATALEPLADRPLVLFGHSMGATLAYEVARRLGARRPAGEPRWLLVSGRRAPSRFRGGTVHLRTDTELVEELRRVGGTDPAFLDDPELLETILPVVRNDYRAIEGYRWTPVPPLTCPITALVGDRDPQTTLDEAAAWKQHTSGAFELRDFAGGHFYLDAHRQGVADAVSRVLERVARPMETLGGNGR